MRPLLLVLCLLLSLAAPAQAEVSFDGVNDYIELDPTTALESQSVTVAFWINPGTQDQAIITPLDFDHCGTPNQSWVVQSEDATTNRNYYFAYHNGTAFEPAGEFGAGKGIQYSANVWQHIAYTKTGTTVIGYKDGAVSWSPAAAGNATISYNSGRNFRIGNAVASTCNTRNVTGTMTDVRIYDRALSAAEVLELSSSRLKYHDVTGAASVAYWPLDDGADGATCNITFVDRSGGGNNATGNGGPTCRGESYLSYVGQVQ